MKIDIICLILCYDSLVGGVVNLLKNKFWLAALISCSPSGAHKVDTVSFFFSQQSAVDELDPRGLAAWDWMMLLMMAFSVLRTFREAFWKGRLRVASSNKTQLSFQISAYRSFSSLR